MPTVLKDFFKQDLNRRCVAYVVKAAVMLALVYLLARHAPSMPLVGIGLCWAVLSAVSAVGIAYHLVIRKVYRQYILKGEKILARLNGGRMLSFVIAFIASAVLVAGVVLESPKWGQVEWAMIAASIPVFLAVFLLMRQFCIRQYEPLFQTSKTVQWSIGITGALLCLGYLVVILNQPAPGIESATDAFLGAPQPFEGSPSAFLSQAGMLIALVDGITTYGLSQVAGFSIWGYVAWRIVLCASAFFCISNLVGMCILDPGELRSVFVKLDEVKRQEKRPAFVKRYLACACILPVALTVAFVVADAQFAKVVEGEEYTAAESLVRDKVGVAARVIDGKYYDPAQVSALVEEARLASEALAQEREEVLTPLINAMFDQQVANVDSYLDWYYSLPADYSRLVQYFTGTVEESMRTQFEERINAGVDDTELVEQTQYYLEQSQALEEDLREKLAQYEIEGVPEWLIVPEETFGADFFDDPLEANHQFLNAGQRLGLSIGSGAVAGVISAKVTQKILGKTFFKKIVAEVTEKLAAKGLVATAGTLVAPGVGTAIGIGFTFVSDFLFLKADEAANRESYRQEIVGAIEEQRAEMLATVAA